MLITFRAENYRSLRDLVEVSAVVPSWVETEDVTIPVGGHGDIRLGSIAAVYGSNASGKTNVLRAMWSMASMVSNSHQSWKPSSKIPYSPFFASPHNSSPVMFEAEVLLNGERHQYGFRFDHDRIIEEWLYVFPKGRPRLLFDRDVNRDTEFRFGRALRGRPQLIADLTRDNSLYLSAAAANNSQQLTELANWFDTGVQRATPGDREAHVRYTVAQVRNEQKKAAILDLLRFADLGISDLRIVSHEVDEELKSRVKSLMQALNPNAEPDEVDWSEIAQGTQLAHRIGDDDTAFLDLDDESMGTRAWLGLIGPIMRALEKGTLLLVDELDASLHPRLSSEVIRIFHDPHLNTQGAQLIFNTHDPSLMGALLGDAPLRRDEVWLTEKGKDGATRLYPLTEFRPRKSENLERGYLQGRYGAVPFVDRDLARAALVRPEGNALASA
ncbi:AAA family ATPase [Micromonospora sp. DT227]|uniref:AAA family ATPase n=1 Tax=Micromonospora sp. DT227 TaxID=3393433 RepID=UPI003CF43B76